MLSVPSTLCGRAKYLVNHCTIILGLAGTPAGCEFIDRRTATLTSHDAPMFYACGPWPHLQYTLLAHDSLSYFLPFQCLEELGMHVPSVPVVDSVERLEGWGR